MPQIEELEDSDDERKETEEEERKRIRDADYLDFRRRFDAIKREHGRDEANSEKMKSQGNQFFSLGCYEQAALMYSEALELQPDSAVLYCNRAMAYLKQGLSEQALADAESSLGIDSEATNIKAYWRKAQALLDLEKFEASEATSDEGLALVPANQHLNTVRRKAREGHALRRLSGCEWVGKVQQGVEKKLRFKKDGTMTMYVFGHPVESTFDLSVEGNPRSMYVKMKPGAGPLAGTGPPPPPVPYIYEFHKDDQELWLCHPVGTNNLPTKFEGPGFDKMKRCQESDQEVKSKGSFEDRCAEYIKAMNDVLPLIPQQLPEQPSDKQIRQEVKLTENMAKLKASYGQEVHKKAVELAKDPTSAGSEYLETLARGLQHRFYARKIIPMPKEESAPVASSAKEGVGNTQAAAVPTAGNGITSDKQTSESLSCLSGIVKRFCGGK